MENENNYNYSDFEPVYKVKGGKNLVGQCKCGRVVNETMHFCPSCGIRIEVTERG